MHRNHNDSCKSRRNICYNGNRCTPLHCCFGKITGNRIGGRIPSGNYIWRWWPRPSPMRSPETSLSGSWRPFWNNEEHCKVKRSKAPICAICSRHAGIHFNEVFGSRHFADKICRVKLFALPQLCIHRGTISGLSSGKWNNDNSFFFVEVCYCPRRQNSVDGVLCPTKLS